MADLIGLAVILLVLALIAYILGARGIAGFSMEIAKWLVIIFIILAILTFSSGDRIISQSNRYIFRTYSVELKNQWH
jgi:uncharacterized membrane protein YtjA (UPF0391 family)